jgi:hypothetical protein
MTYVVTTNENHKKSDWNPAKPQIAKEEMRSGQSFLYRENGVQSMVVDLRMKDKVDGTALQNALSQALLRFPYLTRKMVEKNGKFYLAANPLPFLIKETSELRSLGNSKINYHLIDITYRGEAIYIAFHHGLCDGRGIFPFVETLIYYYCTAKYKREFKVEGIRLVGEKLLPGETAEPFEMEYIPVDNQTQPTGRIAGYALPENAIDLNDKHYYRYEVKIPQDKFVAFSKESGATPAVMVCLLLAKAIDDNREDKLQSIICNLVSDLRQGTGFENTYKNCVAGVALPYVSGVPSTEQAAEFRRLINENKSHNTQKQILRGMVSLFDRFDEIDTFEGKKKALSFFNNVGADTFVVSYIGKPNFGECEQQIDGCYMYGADATGLSVQMSAVGEYITLVFQQNFETDKYVKAFTDIIAEIGLACDVSGLIETIIPKDSTTEKNALVSYIEGLFKRLADA